MFYRRLFACLVLTVSSTYALSVEATAAPIAHFNLVDNRMFVQVKINGKGPYYFIFDTGATFTVTRRVADELGLKLGTPFPIGGAGSGQSQAWPTVVNDFELAGLHLRSQGFTVSSLDAIQNAMGFKRWDGLVGYEFLQAYAARISFDHEEIEFQPAATGFREAEGERTLQLTFYNDIIPVISASADGFSGKFALDTGDRSSLTLMRPFIAKNNLGQIYVPAIHATTGWGTGGPVPALVARTSSFALGPDADEVDQVVTRLPTNPGGFFDSPDLAGSVGDGLLKRYTVTFDYSRKKLTLKRGFHWKDPDPYDRSGMWLIQDGAYFQVYSVVANGPAERAGLTPGDIIKGVNGKNTSDLFLTTVRDLLTHPDLSIVRLETQGADGKARKVILNLQSLI